MSTGLKEQWGLSDPQICDAGSSDQAQKYTADFKSCMSPVSQCLQYTVTHAERCKHDSMVAKRDQVFPAYQAVIPKIDPNDETKAKADIEQVLATANGLSSEAAQLQQETEKSFNAWQAKEPELDKAVTQIEELEHWEDKAAPAPCASADGIHGAVNDRKYAEAVTMLDQLLTNLKPAYDEYLRQKEAKEKYEPALKTLEPRLSQAPPCQFKKLEPMQQEITTVKGQMESAAQNKDYIQALQLVTDLGPKVDAYIAAVKDLEEKKKQYDEAHAALEPKLGDTAQSKFKKLEPMQQDITTVKGQMEAAAQGEDYEQALNHVTDLTAKVDTYLQAVKDLEEKKRQYDEAHTALEPKLGDTAQSKFKKLEPMQQDITTVTGQMEAAAQEEDYDKALNQVNDLSTKVDAYQAAVKDLEEKKKQYDEAHTALEPKLGDTAQSKFKKLEPMQQDITTVKGQMESAAQEEDYEQALNHVTDLTAKVDAYIAAVKDLEEKKRQYDEAHTALEPKLGDTAQSKFKKLDPMQQDITTVKGQMEAAAQEEDFEQALNHVTDLTSKVDAYIAAVKDLEEKKKQYDEAHAALEPKLGDTAQSKFKKLDQMLQDITTVKGQMEAAAQEEDYEQALNHVTDLTTKVDTYIAAVKELEEKKKQYDEAHAALEPKLADSSQSKYAKLAPMQQDITAVQGQMESVAQEEDFEKALNQLNDLSTKVDAYQAAVKELEEKKKVYDDALAALQPKLTQVADSKYEKLTPKQQEITTLQGQMESAAKSDDYEQAAKLAADLTTKVDEFLAAVKELEEKKKAYEQALEALKPKLAEVAKSTYPKLVPKQQEITTLQSQMEAAAQSGDYEQAAKLAADLTAKVDAFLAEAKDLEEKKKSYDQTLTSFKSKLDQAAQLKSDEVAAKLKEISSAQPQADTVAQSGEYEQASKLLVDLTTKVDALLAMPAKAADGAGGGGGGGGGGSAPDVPGEVLTGGGPKAEFEAKYKATLAAGKWQEVAELLKDFSKDEIRSRLLQLTSDQIANLYKGAVSNPRVGPDSNVAILTKDPKQASSSPPADPGPQGFDGPLKSDKDKQAVDSTAVPPDATAASKEDADKLAKGLQKVAEAALKKYLDTPEGKALQEKAEKEVDKLPAAVKYGVPVALLAAATAGLAATHGEFPVDESPDIPMPFTLGPVKVSAKVTWKGPVDKPTESAVTFTFDIPLGKDPPKKTPNTSSGAAGDGPSGNFRPPDKAGTPVLVADFDEGKMGVDKVVKAIASHSEPKPGSGQIQVAYFYDDKTKEYFNAQASAEQWRKAIEQMVSSKYRVTARVYIKSTGQLAAGFNNLGSHDIAIIYTPPA